MNTILQTLNKYNEDTHRTRVKETSGREKREDALLLADKIGFPVAMKISSPDIAHKNAAGCVLLDVGGQDVGAAFETIVVNAKKHAPDARIDGVLVQEMVPRGTEIVIGVTSSPLQVTGLPDSSRLLMQPSPQALIRHSPCLHICS